MPLAVLNVNALAEKQVHSQQFPQSKYMTRAKNMEPESNQPEKTSKGLGGFIYFSSIYFIATGMGYLWAYWSSFSINILEYLAISDVLKHAAFPIASSVASVLIGTVAGTIMGSTHLPPGGEKDSPIGKKLNRYKRLIFLVGLIITIACFASNVSYLLLLAPFLAAFLLMIPVGNLSQVRRLLPDNVRYTVVFFLCLVPFLSITTGELKAKSTIEGSGFQFLVDPALTSATSLRYLGHAGEEYFFYDPREKTTVLIKRLPDKPLVLGRFKR
ncbi:hypothetical protein [Variovorax boronicumulans]|uniref:hypothetical protein n=1 Tax=Variovorax boronicumulans TaxID=436515 RepID=UPI002786BF6F|nr:hypothetical protein [Variovorax boronicumulans]MDQ0041058.1 hypothetical protein [Variovorax boronicumulans]